jgi:hypothetical protein
MYLYDNWARFRNPVTRTWKTSLLVTSNIAIIVIGVSLSRALLPDLLG